MITGEDVLTNILQGVQRSNTLCYRITGVSAITLRRKIPSFRNAQIKVTL
jgi:hypothetical protein